MKIRNILTFAILLTLMMSLSIGGVFSSSNDNISDANSSGFVLDLSDVNNEPLFSINNIVLYIFVFILGFLITIALYKFKS